MGGLYVYHVYFSQVVYGRVIAYSPLNVFYGLALSFGPAARAHSFMLLAGAAGLAGATLQVPRRWAQLTATALLALGVLMLNPKGDPGFPDTAEMVACLGLLALAAGRLLADAQGRHLAAGLAAACLFVAGAEAVARTALTSPHGIRRSQAPLVFLRPNPADAIVRELNRLAQPGEKVLALPFMPALYLFAGRLPASGDYYYLPFQAEYDSAPIRGRLIDLCGDIERVRPPAILVALQPFPVWGSILDYKPCLARLLAADYRPSPVIPFVHIRNPVPIQSEAPTNHATVTNSPPHPSDGAPGPPAAHIVE